MSSPASWEQLRAAAPVIVPSMLGCDFANVEAEVRRLEQAGVRALHLDVMDGHFVPNLTYGPPWVASLRKVTRLPLDVHLMISDPARYVGAFREAGADSMTIHVEAVADPRSVLDEIRRLGASAGIAINPPTPLERLDDCIHACDLVLVMSVMPGFGGQHFDPVALEKLARLRETRPAGVLLEVDGGVNRQTLAACVEAGADLFVVGSAIFGAPDPASTIREMSALLPSPVR